MPSTLQWWGYGLRKKAAEINAGMIKNESKSVSNNLLNVNVNHMTSTAFEPAFVSQVL